MSHFPLSIIVSYEFLCSSFFPLFFFYVFQDESEPISVYHPTVEEISTSMGTPMGGFIDRADVVFKTATPTPPAAAEGVPAKALIPSSEPVPIDRKSVV